ncbi:MAG: VWA domain-containing protein [Acidobacteriota bacterium]|nr:VWA domain-containing protein [Acidobacteriota bacterium]
MLTCVVLPLLLLLSCVIAASAQESEETVRVRTRAVFLDALVRDQRTGSAIPDLKQNDFEVLADGQPRTVSYFNREGEAGRRPLALVIVLDLSRIGAGRFLRRTDILEAMTSVLAKLPPEDEVAVLALDVGGTGAREWLTRLTRDRARVASAMSIIPLLVANGAVEPEPGEGTPPANTSPAGTSPTATSPTATQAGDTPPPPAAAQPKPADTQPAPVDDNSVKKEGTGEIKTANKNGGVTIKYINKDGALVTKTISKDGTESTDVEYGFEFSAAVHEATLLTIADRPNSQAAVVWLSDGIAPVEFIDLAQAEASLIQSNVIFSALVAEMKTGFKLFKPILKPLGNWAGISIYGTSQRVAAQTGGEVVRVRRPEDYANGLGKIVGNLTGRYSLGFTLAETEQDDGQMHKLEVRVRARDTKGRERKLNVVSRRGYFMPKDGESAKTATPNREVRP